MRRPRALRRRYGHAVRLTAAERRRQDDVVLRAVSKLLMGKRLEVAGKPGLGVVYMGSSSENRRDPFWYEGPHGRTYKESAEAIVRAVLPHVGLAAIDNAKVYPS
jgi:hypothetical protein